MRPLRRAAIVLLLVLTACRDEPAAPKPVSAPPFSPPRDGLLQASQVEMWLAVRERVLGRGGSEGVVARAMGVDPREVAWVGERIGEARRLVAGRGLDERIAAARARFRAALQTERPGASPERRAEIDRLLAEFPPAAAGSGPAARNAVVIAPFAARIEALTATAAAPRSREQRQAGKRHQVERGSGQ